MPDYPGEQPAAVPGDSAIYGSGVAVGLTPLAHEYLAQTRPWIRFMSIVVFLAAGLMVVMGIGMLLVSLFAGLVPRDTAAPSAVFSTIGGALLSLLYMALSAVYLVPGLYLSRYAKAIARLKTNAGPEVLEDALKQQRSFWRFVGVTTAISMVLVFVGLVLAVVIGVIAAIGMAPRA